MKKESNDVLLKSLIDMFSVSKVSDIENICGGLNMLESALMQSLANKFLDDLNKEIASLNLTAKIKNVSSYYHELSELFTMKIDFSGWEKEAVDNSEVSLKEHLKTIDTTEYNFYQILKKLEGKYGFESEFVERKISNPIFTIEISSYKQQRIFTDSLCAEY